MNTQTWTLRSLAGVAVLAILAIAASAQGPATVKPAAMVNGEPIPMADVEALIKSRGPLATPPTEVQRKQMQLEALAMLMDDLIMQQFLRQYAPPVDQAELKKRLTEMQAELAKKGQTLQDFCKETGQTEI